MGKKKKRRGHYCYYCDRYRANEKFSGKGHQDHICKDCKRKKRAIRKEQDSFEMEKEIYEIEEYKALLDYEPEWDIQQSTDQEVLDQAHYHHQITEICEGQPFYNTLEQTVITVPTELGDVLIQKYHTHQIDEAITIYLAISLYQDKTITIEQAAKLSGLSFIDFIDLLEEQGIPWEIRQVDSSQES
ncbi:putative HTH domain antitoxin [Evansella vedderi]|uniref:HTH domain antitoxin n=1 Tax=Evansella vedderi TaxID=38282 RepID=A0ABT9ZT30_9BACI|nr:UPF0175 family protein [Evansella vedderi]MDQ0253330.1 putative HTH domain antitoxin [Evansella vedderi]